MLTNNIIGKHIYSGSTLKGVCCGLGFTTKSKLVKYLICDRINSKYGDEQFYISVNSIKEISETIKLKRMRTLEPKNFFKFYLDLPLYSETGYYLGKSKSLEIKNNTAVKLYDDNGNSYSTAAISASGDVIILKKEVTFPLGTYVPLDIDKIKAGSFVSKATLMSAISTGNLINLTSTLLKETILNSQ